MITLSKGAADAVRISLGPETPDPFYLRVWLTEEQDGTLQFHMGLVGYVPEGDEVCESEGISISIEPATAQVLTGSEIDYDESNGGYFHVRLPGAG